MPSLQLRLSSVGSNRLIEPFRDFKLFIFAPVLVSPDPKEQLIEEVDASGTGVEAVVDSLDSQAKGANRQRVRAPEYWKGQKVWLSTKDLALRVESRTLTPHFIRLFPIAISVWTGARNRVTHFV